MPFRGSTAVAAGLVTASQLRGRRFQRVFRDVYLAAEVPLDLAVRSRAAHLLLGDGGCLGGYSAAELLGASCAPAGAPADLIVPTSAPRPQPGLLVRRATLANCDVCTVDGVRMTTPQRTAFDLACRLGLVEAVVAADALARCTGLAPAELMTIRNRQLGARGSRQVPRVVELADPRAESPMETRLRLALVLRGLPPPSMQYPVLDEHADVVARLDLAYPASRVGIEYDGAEHRTQRRAMRDLDRQARLTSLGWRVLRFTPPRYSTGRS